jgi:lysophospholipase L1-like esterase
MLVLALVGYKAYQCRSELQLIKGNLDTYHIKQYAEDDKKEAEQKDKKIVAFGDSIIYGWKFTSSLNGFRLINRGISGEGTDAMVGRFTNDVIILKPQYVIILAGINDVAAIYDADPGGTDLQIQKIVSNIRLMAEAARTQGIVPIVCSLLPVNDYYTQPAPAINQIVIPLNRELQAMTATEDIIYVDFWSVVVDPHTGMLRTDYSQDGIHPNSPAYQAMWTKLSEVVKLKY